MRPMLNSAVSLVGNSFLLILQMILIFLKVPSVSSHFYVFQDLSPEESLQYEPLITHKVLILQ